MAIAKGPSRENGICVDRVEGNLCITVLRGLLEVWWGVTKSVAEQGIVPEGGSKYIPCGLPSGRGIKESGTLPSILINNFGVSATPPLILLYLAPDTYRSTMRFYSGLTNDPSPSPRPINLYHHLLHPKPPSFSLENNRRPWRTALTH